MKLLFSDEGRKRLDEMIKPGVLCMFDYDGTLVPIVAQPDKAVMSNDILRQLVALSSHAKVGIVTGRSMDDIRARLRFNADFVIGNHGMEGVPGWEKQTEKNEVICQGWARALNAAFEKPGTFEPGILLENKRYSLSVHYRLVRDHIETEKRLIELFQTLEPRPRVMGGKYVFNLLPMGAADKGSALAQLMAVTDAPGAIYVGDDITDEDVFRLHRHDILTVRIESYPRSAAEFYLRDRREMSRLLDDLIHRFTSKE
jgi:trehalose 6-phosphate phosphatase